MLGPLGPGRVPVSAADAAVTLSAAESGGRRPGHVCGCLGARGSWPPRTQRQVLCKLPTQACQHRPAVPRARSRAFHPGLAPGAAGAGTGGICGWPEDGAEARALLHPRPPRFSHRVSMFPAPPGPGTGPIWFQGAFKGAARGRIPGPGTATSLARYLWRPPDSGLPLGLWVGHCALTDQSANQPDRPTGRCQPASVTRS